MSSPLLSWMGRLNVHLIYSVKLREPGHESLGDVRDRSVTRRSLETEEEISVLSVDTLEDP